MSQHNFRQRCTDNPDCDCSRCCMCYTCVFDRRSYSIFSGMQSRLKEKKWKSGVREGKTRIAKRELPFTLEQFRAWLRVVLEDTPYCEYCHQSININTISPDHAIPVKRGGSLEIKNLRPCDSDCNTLKGSLLPGEFKAFLGLLAQFPQAAREDICRRMKGGMKHFRPTGKKDGPKATNVLAIPAPKKSVVEDDF